MEEVAGVSGAGGADLAVEVFGFPAGEHNGLGLREVGLHGEGSFGKVDGALQVEVG